MSQTFKAINYTSRPASLSVLSLGMAAALMVASPTAVAQSAATPTVGGLCDPEVARQLAQRYQQKQKDAEETLHPLLETIKDEAENSIAALSACTDLSWPSMKITYPSMDQIIRGVAQTAVRKACGTARDLIAEKDSLLRDSFYLNTRIPGVPSFGITTTGSGSGGITWGSPASGGSYGSTVGGGTSPIATPPIAPPPTGFPGGGLFNPPPPPSGPAPPITP